jgi:hypothetical protein
MCDSQCERQTHLHHRLVSVTHIVRDRHIDMLSSCDIDRHIDMLSSCDIESIIDRHIESMTSTCYHLVSSNLSTVLFDRHIDVPSSCEFDRHIDMLSHVAKKNCAISQPLLNEGTCMREYSTIRPIRHISFTSF